MSVDTILADVKAEYESACSKFPSFHTPHEGYAVLLEEVDELWDCIKLNQHKNQNRDARICEEAIQVAAMAIRLIHDVLDTGEPEPVLCRTLAEKMAEEKVEAEPARQVRPRRMPKEETKEAIESAMEGVVEDTFKLLEKEKAAEPLLICSNCGIDITKQEHKLSNLFVDRSLCKKCLDLCKGA